MTDPVEKWKLPARRAERLTENQATLLLRVEQEIFYCIQYTDNADI